MPVDPRYVPDRRRFQRFEISLGGRFMRADKQEFPCLITNLSPGGVSIRSEAPVEQDERIVVYIDDVGGLEGKVARLEPGGFAIALTVSGTRREKLAAQITWLVNKSEMGGVAARRHQRISVPQTTSTLKLNEHTSVECRILDVSISGASVGTTARPEIGSEVYLGKMRCRVMRYHEKGLGVQFLEQLDTETVQRNLR